ncbi:hypothetical protein [Piscirickettsia litoralis]|uniref:5-carboxymethyl-2-hydroxymuconate isomerase n=1 Tax=Piscirickettsia litoralis TaxID=1891921 RepID=A0ABX3A2D5_9GAMM|nr:hypothetical protein [Piscirickettsia litoralis]ODN43017.1 hypothetical protein BGC07_08940 [Piscirickettsia litoralis]
MPHIELKYSDDLLINADEIFEVIENVINQHDSSSGVCKGRAYPTGLYKHTHILISLSLLEKPHRDDNFSQELINKLEKEVKKIIQQDCYFSLSLNYNLSYYITNQHHVEKSC